jgi:hypothetical protein
MFPDEQSERLKDVVREVGDRIVARLEYISTALDRVNDNLDVIYDEVFEVRTKMKDAR